MQTIEDMNKMMIEAAKQIELSKLKSHYGHNLDTVDTIHGPYGVYCTECEELISGQAVSLTEDK